MNRLAKTGLWLLVFSMICLPAMADKVSDTEVVTSYGMETTYFHGPIPIRLASPGENDISMEEALRIAHRTALEEGFLAEFELEWCTTSVNYVILSDVNESYHIGGWVITYFPDDSNNAVQTVIIEGASGDVLFAASGMQAGITWTLYEKQEYEVALGSQNFLWPVEWRAVFEIVFCFPNPTLIRDVLPTENDISQDTALEIAKEAVLEKYGVSEREIEQYLVGYSLLSGWHIDEGGTKGTVWRVIFYSTESDEWGNWTPVYSVIMTSQDGKAILVNTP